MRANLEVNCNNAVFCSKCAIVPWFLPKKSPKNKNAANPPFGARVDPRAFCTIQIQSWLPNDAVLCFGSHFLHYGGQHMPEKGGWQVFFAWDFFVSETEHVTYTLNKKVDCYNLLPGCDCFQVD